MVSYFFKASIFHENEGEVVGGAGGEDIRGGGESVNNNVEDMEEGEGMRELDYMTWSSNCQISARSEEVLEFLNAAQENTISIDPGADPGTKKVHDNNESLLIDTAEDVEKKGAEESLTAMQCWFLSEYSGNDDDPLARFQGAQEQIAKTMSHLIAFRASVKAELEYNATLLSLWESYTSQKIPDFKLNYILWLEGEELKRKAFIDKERARESRTSHEIRSIAEKLLDKANTPVKAKPVFKDKPKIPPNQKNDEEKEFTIS